MSSADSATSAGSAGAGAGAGAGAATAPTSGLKIASNIGFFAATELTISKVTAQGAILYSHTAMWPQDADHQFFTDASTPRLSGVERINLADAAAHCDCFLTQHNFMIPFAVRVLKDKTVTVSRVPPLRMASADFLFDLRKKFEATSQSSTLKEDGIALIHLDVPLVSGEKVRICGPCVPKDWNPKALVEMFTDTLLRLTHVVNIWVCNGDSIPIYMPKTMRSSMRGHSVIIEQRTPRGHWLFCVNGFRTTKVLLTPGEEVRFVWGGQVCTSNIFAPVIGFTSSIFDVRSKTLSSFATWASRLRKADFLTRSNPRNKASARVRATLVPCMQYGMHLVNEHDESQNVIPGASVRV